jgi:hypothetical protein
MDIYHLNSLVLRLYIDDVLNDSQFKNKIKLHITKWQKTKLTKRYYYAEYRHNVLFSTSTNQECSTSLIVSRF